jgi:signal transduction histidine kinase/ligand-binding sensor domain-containing protein
MRRAFLLAIIWGFLVPELRAQPSLYSTRNYTAIDGLPQSQVTSVVEDANGYLWVGTEGGGLARFDGNEFKVYTTKDGLLSNNIAGLHIDRHQNLWVLHLRGMAKFDGRTFRRFQRSGTPNTATRFARIYEHGDSIFAVAMNGNIAKIHHDSIFYWEKPLLKNKPIVWFHQGPAGVNCFLMKDGTYAIQERDRLITFSPEPVQEKIYCFFNYKGDILFCTEHALFKLDYKNRKLQKLPWNVGHRVLLYDEKQDFFWTSNGNTVFRETINGGVVKCDTVLRDVDINLIVNDSEGNAWLGSDGRGLYKYFIQDFKRCGSDDFRGVMSIARDHENTTWLGTLAKGLWKIKKGKVSSYLEGDENGRNSVPNVKVSPQGTLWVGTKNGLGRYEKEKDDFTWFGRKDGLAGNAVNAIDFDERGRLWVGTNMGLSLFDGTSFRSYTTEDGLVSNSCWTLHYSRKYKTLFIGNDFGIQSLKDEKMDAVPNLGLSNTVIIGIQPYRDSLLMIATGGAGVAIFNPKTGARNFLTTQEGLASDFVYFATEDEDDNLWIGTEKGINRVKLDGRLAVVENLYYGYENGLTGVETNSNAFYITQKNKYFGLVDGLYEFNELSKEPHGSFDLHLTDIEIFYGEYSPHDYADSLSGFFKIPYRPQLPPDKNHITFYFNQIDKRYPASIKFKYYLDNFDKTWSQPSSMRMATYSNLPPGDYVFRVMSTNNRGSWNKETLAYAFTIKTPFYKTASFITGIFVLVAGIITFILYMRVKQRVNKMITLERIRIKEQETLRKEIARDFHDEMGNQLTRIINYVSLLKLNGSSNGSHDLYTKVENSAKYLYTGTRDFIWSIDPVNDELSKLFIHIRDFGETLFEEKNIQFRAFNEIKEKVKLPYGFSREANLIFKEAMTNAFKYSGAKNVTLQLKRTDDDGFEMSIADDGIGFYTDQIEKSNGLKNIHERADRIHAVLRISSVKNHGTNILLNFKLTKNLKYGIAL